MARKKMNGLSLMGLLRLHDGYTLYIEDVNVKLQFGFHNQYHFDYDSKEQYESFEKKLKQIDKEY